MNRHHAQIPPQQYDGHHGSNHSTSNNRYAPYNRNNHRNYSDQHRRYDSKPYDRNRGSSRGGFGRGIGYRGRGGYRGGYRGGFRGGFRGGRGGRGGRGRGRGGFKAKYEFITALNPQLLASIRQLSLDKRGAEPLRKWIDKINNSEYVEARFKSGVARKIKSNGVSVNDMVKIEEIPSSAQVIIDRNSDQWLENMPGTNNKIILTFPQSVNVTTNSIRIDHKSLTVHQYTFDIESVEHNAPVTMETDDRRSIYRKSKRHLKEFNPHIFDNRHIFSFNKNVPKNAIFSVEKGMYKIILQLQKSTNSDENIQNNYSFMSVYKSCPIYFQQQGMNILNRKRFTSANYAQLHPREDVFYSLQDINSMETWNQNGTDLKYPDLRLLKGYKSTITISCLIKNQLNRKLITKHSLHDLIRANGIDAVDKWVKGKRAITSYSDQIIEIHGLDTSLNLDSTFITRNGKISYRQYYSNKRDSRTNRMIKLLEKQEDCLIIHHRYIGKGKDKKIINTNHFLPQLLHVIVSMEQQNDHTKQQLRKRSHPPVQIIIDKALEINAILAKTARNALFSTNDRAIQVRGFFIDAPYICFKTGGKIGKESAERFCGRVWKCVDDFWYNLKSIYSKNNCNNSKYNNNTINWAICYDNNGRSGDAFARDVEKFFHQFNNNQGFRIPPLNRPKIIAMDFKDLNTIRNTLRNSAFSVALFILGQDEIYRKYKVDITRHVLFNQEPSNALSSVHSRNDSNKWDSASSNNLCLDLQFIHEATIRKRAAVFGVFNTLLLKSGISLYYIQPQLPSNVFNYTQLWMIGIKILRKKGGANLLILSCNRAPFVGAIKYITNHSAMISSGQDVIPQHIMKQLTMDMLKGNLRKIINSNGDEQLPLNIIILRCSGSDGLLKTIISKEVAGFKQSLYAFCKKEKNLIKKIQKRWHPGCMYSVLQENVPDAFGITNNNKIVYSQRALVVSEGITSTQYLDVFISLPTKQEKQLYGRVIRLITLMEDYNSGTTKQKRPHIKLSKSPQHLSDYISLIYSSIWGYALNIPFPKIPNYPSVIKFAEHFAKWQYSMLTDHDTNLNQLNIDIDNAKPKICDVVVQNNIQSDIIMKYENESMT